MTSHLILSLTFSPKSVMGRRRFARCIVEMGDCAESFVRVDDRICDHDWVGGGDPLEN